MSQRNRAPDVADLRAELGSVLSRCVPAGSTVALVDFPSYANVGDSAIWLGTLEELRRLKCRVAYVCEHEFYSREALERRLPPGSPVLVQGGGNFGDLWPGAQVLRERVIADFPDRPIVLLPVTITFRSAEAEERAEATLNRHERLTLLCRDAPSLAYAEAHYGTRVMLCPDAALALTPPRRRPPDREITMLLRSDHEAVNPVLKLPGAGVLDWSSEPHEPGHSRWWERKWRLSRLIARAARETPALEGVGQAPVRRLFQSMARQRLAFGYEVVSSGRVLVTDRLHGHILALLLDVPHVVLDTRYGKVRSFYETFSRGVGDVTFCEDPDELEALVRSALEH